MHRLLIKIQRKDCRGLNKKAILVQVMIENFSDSAPESQWNLKSITEIMIFYWKVISFPLINNLVTSTDYIFSRD